MATSGALVLIAQLKAREWRICRQDQNTGNTVMRIMLINPPVRTPQGLNVGTDNRAQSFPFCLLYLASSLEQEGHVVSIYDCAASPCDNASIVAAIKIASPELVGITATTPSFLNAMATSAISSKFFREIVAPVGLFG